MALQQTQEQSPEKGKITTRVLEQIDALRNRGALTLPADYDAANALNSAWLAMQTIQNKDKKPIVKNGQIDTTVVSMASVVNALHDYVIQGLNVAKNQAYLIVYAQELTMQRSYFGDQMLAERVKPGIEIYSGLVYEGDEFEFELVRGRTVVTKHKSKLENQSKAIIAAYAGIVDTTGEDLGADVMTWARIQKSWSKSKAANYDNSTHKEFPGEMALRTVLRHRCKRIINASTDALLMEAVRRQEIDNADTEFAEEVEANANGEVINLAPSLEQRNTEANIPPPSQEAPKVDAEPKKAAPTAKTAPAPEPQNEGEGLDF